MSLPYYKRFPRDFLDGTIGLPLDVKGGYAVLLDLIYMRDGKLVDDPRYIAGQLGCSVRKWNTIRDALIQAGKITVQDGVISNFRANYLTEESRKYQDKQAEIAGKPRKNKQLPQPEPSQSESESEDREEAIASPPERAAARVAPLFEIEDAPRVRRKPTEAEFDRWWAAYPLKVGKLAARAAFDRAWARVDAEPDDRIEVLLRATDGFAEAKRVEGRPSRFTAHPTTWLNEGRWLDETPIAEAGFDNEQRDPKWEAKAANMQRAFAGALLAAGEGDQCG
jgi:uncharacterized protein YdaU (DUF1376 family)